MYIYENTYTLSSGYCSFYCFSPFNSREDKNGTAPTGAAETLAWIHSYVDTWDFFICFPLEEVSQVIVSTSLQKLLAVAFLEGSETAVSVYKYQQQL